MQKLTLFLLFVLTNLWLHAQNVVPTKFPADTLIHVKKNSAKGFENDYLLFIPKGTLCNQKTFLLVEPNNTGKLSDSSEVHHKHALFIATKSSVGNNIATELKIPLLVPIFPRPASKPLTYTHALDRDVMMETSTELQRLDLQLVQMIIDAQQVLKSHKVLVHDKIFMNGFSASATFTNRFSLLHPDKIQALAIGGFNGELMLPEKKIKDIELNYPIGINDFEQLFHQTFDIETYKTIPQLIYMGALDDNDAVQFDDAYDSTERRIINDYIGATVPLRYVTCQNKYKKLGINATFKTYEKIGHWTTSHMNLEVIRFFMSQLQQNDTKK